LDYIVSLFCSIRYTSLKGNEFFSEVDDEYAQDSFNLTGLASLVSNFEAALDLILDVETSTNDMMTDDQQEQIENDAETLFGLVHARYILTSRGLAAMFDKYKQADFGKCPRVLCDGQPLLPVGLSDQPTQHAVKLFCPRCEDVYHPSNPRHQHIDGRCSPLALTPAPAL
jgi:casein kinase II subunit beta